MKILVYVTKNEKKKKIEIYGSHVATNLNSSMVCYLISRLFYHEFYKKSRQALWVSVFLVIGCFNQMTTYFQLAVWFTASVIEKKLNFIAINFSRSGSYKPINRLFFNPPLFLPSRGKLQLPIF